MKKIIFIAMFLILSNTKFIFGRSLLYTPPANNSQSLFSDETLKLQAEFVELKSESQKHSDMIDQLRASCLVLKKENKLMKEALSDPNFAGYLLNENNLRTTSKQISDMSPLPSETPKAQTLIIKFRTDIKKQSLLINQLNTTYAKLKEENKLTKKALADANLPIPDLFELYEKEQHQIEAEKQKKQQQLELQEQINKKIKPYFQSPLSIGQIARLGQTPTRDFRDDRRKIAMSYGCQQRMKIIQIVDDKNMIVELLLYAAYTAYYGERPPINNETTENVWVNGIDTKDMADNQIIPTNDYIFKITGTKKYGADTFLIFEPYDPNTLITEN